jgi:adenylate cyclase
MSRLESISTPTALDLVVSFSSLAGFNKRFVLPSDDPLVFNTMQDYFHWAGDFIRSRGGTVIKCMGDAMLLVFPADEASQAVTALRELKTAGDLWLKQRDVPCQHLIKIHLGPLLIGPIGPLGQERLDVYGKTVNICATLESGPLVMTPQVFRALNSEVRKNYKKHTPPVTYIRVEDSH